VVNISWVAKSGLCRPPEGLDQVDHHQQVEAEL
jgi:hypothetical protein